MNSLLFQHRLYLWLSPRLALGLRLILITLFALGIWLLLALSDTLGGLSHSLDTQARLQQRVENMRSESVGESVAANELSRFRSEVSQLQRLMPRVSIQPITLLNHIETRLSPDMRLRGFDYVGARGEFLLKLEARDRASIQAFITDLEQVKALKEIELKESRPLPQGQQHTVVIRI